eukprot:scaffold93681_cov16-Tisochrysis_lutea.AAC.1
MRAGQLSCMHPPGQRLYRHSGYIFLSPYSAVQEVNTINWHVCGVETQQTTKVLQVGNHTGTGTRMPHLFVEVIPRAQKQHKRSFRRNANSLCGPVMHCILRWTLLYAASSFSKPCLPRLDRTESWCGSGKI